MEHPQSSMIRAQDGTGLEELAQTNGSFFLPQHVQDYNEPRSPLIIGGPSELLVGTQSHAQMPWKYR